jgi:hypothetical protein
MDPISERVFLRNSIDATIVALGDTIDASTKYDNADLRSDLVAINRWLARLRESLTPSKMERRGAKLGRENHRCSDQPWLNDEWVLTHRFDKF